MVTTNIQGDWTGIFKLLHGYRKYNGQETSFTMRIEQSGEKFSGHAKDIDGIGIHQDQAVISGHIDNEGISFVKQYPSTHYLDSKGELVIDKSRVAPLISYEGNYNSETNSFEGNGSYLHAFIF